MDDNIKIKTGKCVYAWIDYISLGEKSSVQLVHWPNGAGFTVHRNDDTVIEFEWEEWEAIVKGIKNMETSMSTFSVDMNSSI